ncbi:hypothetical protein [Brasilonema sennae]|uniref:hypothetical protein n=1 Tax=Brasilonema sennae TaxID=1397703 RepID=UPI001C130BFC|nr:hypothetical protein [Brasilonema sennae]
MVRQRCGRVSRQPGDCEPEGWTADQFVELKDPNLGLLRLHLWRNLHFQQSAKIKMYWIQVQRLNEDAVNQSKPLWLAWVGMDMPELSEFWRLYLHPNPVESPLAGLLANPGCVEFVTLQLKKLLLSQRKNQQSQLDLLVFIFSAV